MKIVRLYSGSDQKSHFEEIEMKFGGDQPMTQRTLRIVTLNIHKGLSHFNRRMVIHDLRDGLRALAPDLVFLQEVQGLNHRYALRFAGTTSTSRTQCCRKSWPDRGAHPVQCSFPG